MTLAIWKLETNSVQKTRLILIYYASKLSVANLSMVSSIWYENNSLLMRHRHTLTNFVDNQSGHTENLSLKLALGLY